MNAPTEPIGTTTSGGTPIFPVFGALAECERDNIRERTQAGMAEGWRPKKLGTPTKMAMMRHLSADHSHAIADIARAWASRGRRAIATSVLLAMGGRQWPQRNRP
jgi:DNA invertase Pin-like site-specific DNA recombinase